MRSSNRKNAEGPSPRLRLPRTAANCMCMAMRVDLLLEQTQQLLEGGRAAQVHKSVWRLRQAGARRVALQFPEGLLMYSCIISDILEACAPQRRMIAACPRADPHHLPHQS